MSSGIISSINDIVSVVGLRLIWSFKSSCAFKAMEVARKTMAPNPWIVIVFWLYTCWSKHFFLSICCFLLLFFQHEPLYSIYNSRWFAFTWNINVIWYRSRSLGLSFMYGSYTWKLFNKLILKLQKKILKPSTGVLFS